MKDLIVNLMTKASLFKGATGSEKKGRSQHSCEGGRMLRVEGRIGGKPWDRVVPEEVQVLARGQSVEGWQVPNRRGGQGRRRATSLVHSSYSYSSQGWPD